MIAAAFGSVMLLAGQSLLAPEYDGVSDSDLIPQLAGARSWNTDVGRELGNRLDEYPPSQHSTLLLLLMSAVETNPDRSVRLGCAAEVGRAASARAADRAVIAPHMRRVIASREANNITVIEWYIKDLSEFDQSPETRQLLVSIVEDPPRSPFRESNFSVWMAGLAAMMRFGEDGERFLIEYAARRREPLALEPLAATGGPLAYEFLHRHALARKSELRQMSTQGLATWAQTKQRGSADWVKVVRVLRMLSCDRDPTVKEYAGWGLQRLEEPVPAHCPAPRKIAEPGDDDGEAEEDRSRRPGK